MSPSPPTTATQPTRTVIRLLTAIVCLQSAMLVLVWSQGGPALPEPTAGARDIIPSAADAQLRALQTIDTRLETTNAKLGELGEFLRSGQLQVVAAPAEEE